MHPPSPISPSPTFSAAAMVAGEFGSDDDDGFEFSFSMRDSELPSPVSADEIFHNGRIRPVYPVSDKRSDVGVGSNSAVRMPLRKLFIEERETAVTRTTSDDLEGIPEETYCVWRPSEAAEGMRDKSNSAGSNSKRWKLRDLVQRGLSGGGKDRFAFFAASSSGRRKGNEEKVETPPVAGNVESAGGEKRRPYGQNVVGPFSVVSGSTKILQQP